MMENSKKIPGTCLLMAGGKGKRMGNPLKFLLEIDGRSILECLTEIIHRMFDTVYITVTPANQERIRAVCKDCNILVTSGEDYAFDLNMALGNILHYPVLVLGSDTVIIDMETFIPDLKRGYSEGTDLVNLIARKSGFNASIFKRPPSSPTEVLEHTDIFVSEGIAININTRSDLKRASSMILKGTRTNQ
ncbi:MAG: NTP transferase domain-containing protein [Candidatus Thermoplasmatota archaeon]|nr:NTP transferase domain-containing protein [Candidatus Thermoplasmatota archaeon]